MAHEIFISYAAEDKPIADAVCEAIESQQINCWYAPRDVEYAKDFEESIVDAIGASRLIILILTSHSNTSAHVKREIQNACTEGINVPVLPFRVEDVPLNKALRYYIGSVHWLDALTTPLEPHLDRLVEHVKARVEKSPREPNAQPETDRPSSRSTDEPPLAQSHEPEIIADSTFEEEFATEESPAATRGPNLKTFAMASGIFLLVVIVGIALLVGISSLLTSKSPQPNNEPANPSANSNVSTGLDAPNNPSSLAGLEVSVFYHVHRDQADRIAERLRRHGAQVSVSPRADASSVLEGGIFYYEGRAENAKKIAAIVSDIESFTPTSGTAGSAKGSQLFIYVKSDR